MTLATAVRKVAPMSRRQVAMTGAGRATYFTITKPHEKMVAATAMAATPVEVRELVCEGFTTESRRARRLGRFASSHDRKGALGARELPCCSVSPW